MRDRVYVESLPNWQATFQQVGGQVVCLMRTLRGGFYWDTPDYAGLFAWGATASFDLRAFQDALRTARLRLLTGQIPDFQRMESPCASTPKTAAAAAVAAPSRSSIVTTPP
jgi:hypothetical protein